MRSFDDLSTEIKWTIPHWATYNGDESWTFGHVDSNLEANTYIASMISALRLTNRKNAEIYLPELAKIRSAAFTLDKHGIRRLEWFTGSRLAPYIISVDIQVLNVHKYVIIESDISDEHSDLIPNAIKRRFEKVGSHDLECTNFDMYNTRLRPLDCPRDEYIDKLQTASKDVVGARHLSKEEYSRIMSNVTTPDILDRVLALLTKFPLLKRIGIGHSDMLNLYTARMTTRAKLTMSGEEPLMPFYNCEPENWTKNRLKIWNRSPFTTHYFQLMKSMPLASLKSLQLPLFGDFSDDNWRAPKQADVDAIFKSLPQVQILDLCGWERPEDPMNKRLLVAVMTSLGNNPPPKLKTLQIWNCQTHPALLTMLRAQTQVEKLVIYPSCKDRDFFVELLKAVRDTECIKDLDMSYQENSSIIWRLDGGPFDRQYVLDGIKNLADPNWSPTEADVVTSSDSEDSGGFERPRR